jgi:hypothetical protein
VAFENNNVKSVQKNHIATFPVFEIFVATHMMWATSTDMRPQNVTTNKLAKVLGGAFFFRSELALLVGAGEEPRCGRIRKDVFGIHESF